MPCNACGKKFFLFIVKKKCRDCERHFCAKCAIRREDCVRRCNNCSVLSKRPLARCQVLEIPTEDTRHYLARKILSPTFLEEENLVNILMQLANGAKSPMSRDRKIRVSESPRVILRSNHSTLSFTKNIHNTAEEDEELLDEVSNDQQLSTIMELPSIERSTQCQQIVEYPLYAQIDMTKKHLARTIGLQKDSNVAWDCCNFCKKPIVGQYTKALDKIWHIEHFTCTHCNLELNTRNFFEREGRPYCETDYHNLFSPRCAYCSGVILEECVVAALGKTWHAEHFVCAQCGKQIREKRFYTKDEKPYCPKDYFDMFAPKCGGCNGAIVDDYVICLGSQWHPRCFICTDCKEPISSEAFSPIKGKPLCPKCVDIAEL